MNDEIERKNRLVEKLKIAKKYSRKTAFQEELLEYLQSKLANYDVPAHEFMEMVQYIMIGNDIVVRDEVERAYRLWNSQAKRGIRRNRGEE